MIRSSLINRKGFTLIEVAVALAILGWVLGAAIFLVSQYADQRVRMRERFLSNQVAWNQLMGEYQHVHGWRQTTGGNPEVKGRTVQGNQQWYWQMNIEAALGQDMYKYQVNVAAAGDGRSEEIDEDDLVPSLSLYLINTTNR